MRSFRFDYLQWYIMFYHEAIGRCCLSQKTVHSMALGPAEPEDGLFDDSVPHETNHELARQSMHCDEEHGCENRDNLI